VMDVKFCIGFMPRCAEVDQGWTRPPTFFPVAAI